MFTGIVTEMGIAVAVHADTDRGITRLGVQLGAAAKDVNPGASIAISGVCLTALDQPVNGVVTVEVMGETMARTTLAGVKSGDHINIERALSANGRFDGHIVQGHVDTVTTLLSRENQGSWEVFRFALNTGDSSMVVSKGSIALDGVSLTVSALGVDWFEVSLIPVTLRDTTLGRLVVGDKVNVEFDILAKHLTSMSQDRADDKARARNTLDAAIDALRRGKPVIVRDAPDRENEGDIIFAAEDATAELMAWTIRHSSGVVCVPMESERLIRLELPPMVSENQDPKGTNYSISADAASGITTGISAADRAVTVRALASPQARGSDFQRPGHIFPLGAHPGGISERAGHTEASLELMRLAGKEPVAVIAEITNDDGTMTCGPELEEFAATWDTPLISIEELRQHLESQDLEPRVLEAQAAATALQESPPVQVNTTFGTFTARAFREESGLEHLLLSAPGTPSQQGAPVQQATAAASVTASAPGAAQIRNAPGRLDPEDSATPLVRLHSECLTGDVFGSARCDCGDQLEAALRLIASEGGHLVYLRGQEGRGIGLFDKIRAYAKQDSGLDTVDANLALGHSADARSYTTAAAILHARGIAAVRLITNNPAKERELVKHHIGVQERVHVPTPVRGDNVKYLNTKQQRMGHLLNLPETATEGHGA